MRRENWYAFVFLCGVLAVAISIFSVRYGQRIEKERAIIMELNQFRTAIILYKNTYGINPENLDVIMNAKYPNVVFVPKIKLNEQGVPIDPFGGSYSYDSDSGFIRSETDAYAQW